MSPADVGADRLEEDFRVSPIFRQPVAKVGAQPVDCLAGFNVHG